MIGPATDAFGNLTNLENMTLEILTEVPIDQSQYIETDEKKMNPSNSSADVSKLSFDDKKPKLDIQTVAENSKNSEKKTSNSIVEVSESYKRFIQDLRQETEEELKKSEKLQTKHQEC